MFKKISATTAVAAALMIVSFMTNAPTTQAAANETVSIPVTVTSAAPSAYNHVSVTIDDATLANKDYTLVVTDVKTGEMVLSSARVVNAHGYSHTNISESFVKGTQLTYKVFLVIDNEVSTLVLDDADVYGSKVAFTNGVLAIKA